MLALCAKGLKIESAHGTFKKKRKSNMFCTCSITYSLHLQCLLNGANVQLVHTSFNQRLCNDAQ